MGNIGIIVIDIIDNWPTLHLISQPEKFEQSSQSLSHALWGLFEVPQVVELLHSYINAIDHIKQKSKTAQTQM